MHNPGLTGGVQNQPDFQAGSVDHRTHFVREVPRIAREVMQEYSALTGREYGPIKTYMCEDAETVMIGLGSVTDDAQAVATHLRAQGKKVGVISVKLLQPFPEAEVVAALRGKKAVTVLERSDVTALTTMVTQALFKARENVDGVRHPGIPPVENPPKITTAIFGLGAHDLQPRHLIAAFKNMEAGNVPFVYLGSQFFSKNPSPRLAALQEKLRAAYPETELMALETEPNPDLLPKSAIRIRFHSVGGYGTIATGKLLTDILAGALDLHSKAAPKYGSEKSGAPTNYYITLSPEPVLHHQRRARGRRTRRFARPQGVQPQQSVARAQGRRHVHPSVAAARRPRSGKSCRSRRARPSATRRSISSSSTPSRSPSATLRRRNLKSA